MKTEKYLNLCLEQAAKSPLRYRHGAIIVRGGKVIGQGYNDVRNGFDGGALKTGRLSVRSLDGPAIAQLKKKHKLKRETVDQKEEATKTFTPFESMTGGGRLANTTLSMHSERMAIHSALSVANTAVSSAVSSEKPCFKLSGCSDKRKARLRQEAIKNYVKTVCKQALLQSSAKQFVGKSEVQEWRFEPATSGPRNAQSCVSRRGLGQYGAFIPNEQYDETPEEEREVPSSSQQ
jgi:deoxycytidylate deaminase